MTKVKETCIGVHRVALVETTPAEPTAVKEFVEPAMERADFAAHEMGELARIVKRIHTEAKSEAGPQ